MRGVIIHQHQTCGFCVDLSQDGHATCLYLEAANSTGISLREQVMPADRERDIGCSIWV